eukprot:scaffold295289_cov33-Prasinocladus_malaysianus.AAC.1
MVLTETTVLLFVFSTSSSNRRHYLLRRFASCSMARARKQDQPKHAIGSDRASLPPAFVLLVAEAGRVQASREMATCNL